MSGYVYLIGNSRFHWYKIGKSKTPEIRVGDLGILLPFKIKIFGIWEAQNHSLMESSMHELYSDARINGEWFTFSDKRVKEIYSLLPLEACVFWHLWENSDQKFKRFSNMHEDILSPKPKCVKIDVIQLFRREV